MQAGFIEKDLALATTYQASPNEQAINGRLQQVVYVFWTPGTAANVLSVDIQTTCVEDGSTMAWTSDHEWTAAAGTKTKTDNTYTFTAAGTSEVGLRIIAPLGGDKIRVRVKESEAGSSTKGTATVKVYSVND